MSGFLPDDGSLHIHTEDDDHLPDLHIHHSFKVPLNLKPTPPPLSMATVLPPILPLRQHHQHPHPHPHPPHPVASIPQRQPSPPPPPQQPVLPPQQRPPPVVNAKERVTVNGIPSQTVVDGTLLIGHDTSTSERSYTPLKNVGDGSFGTVVLADWHSPLPPGVSISPMQLNIKFSSANAAAPMRMVAIKRMKKKWQNGWSECAQLKELESLRRIAPHPNIIPLYDSFLMPETKELYFIFECMEGNLYQLIKSRKGRPLAGGLVASIYRQVVLGLQHIHDSGYFHRDMKPENLLVTTTGLADYSPTSPLITQPAHLASPEKDVMVIVKLADFGLAREINSRPPYTEYVSTRWYRAPEVLLRSTDYSTPVDMWALGTIMAELVNLKPIFPGQTEMDQVKRITEVLGNPTVRGEYGVDGRGRVRGGGDWQRGIRMGSKVGYVFKQTKPLAFHTLFDRSVPSSLVDCIADLIRYDPEKRLTAQQCRDHPYWKETEHTQRGTIATQAAAAAPPPSSEQQQQPPQPRRRPSHIQIPRPPNTNASSTSSNKSLRAAVASMGLQHPHPHGSAGYSHSHSRAHSAMQQHQHGMVLPQMSPRTLPPSHSHPLSPGKSKPFFNGNADVPPMPLPPAGELQSHSTSALLQHPTPPQQQLNNSQSHPNLHLHAHRNQYQQHPGPDAFSPITPSVSPGMLFSPMSGDELTPGGGGMSVGAMQYQQAAIAHYNSTTSRSRNGYTGRSHGSMPGTSKSGEQLVEQMQGLDVIPPVPPMPWSVASPASHDANGRESVLASSIIATIGSDEGMRYEDQSPEGFGEDDPSAPMEISRGSLELSASDPSGQKQPSPAPKPVHAQPQPQQPPAAPVPHQGGGKFSLFGKKKTWGLFGHGSDNKGDGAGDANMASSSSMPAVPNSVAAPPSVPAVMNSLKRGPSGSAGSLDELHQQQQQQVMAPVDPKLAKKLADKVRKEEARLAYDMKIRKQQERSRKVMDNKLREETAETSVTKVPLEWRTHGAALIDQREGKGKGVLRAQQSSLTLGGGGVRRPAVNGVGGPTTQMTKPPEDDKAQQQQARMHQHQQGQHLHPIPQGSQYSGSYQHELHSHMHRHKARRRDADDDHSMSSSDVQSVSRMSMLSYSTIDSDQGPNRHRMVLAGGTRSATIGPYATGNGSHGGVINRATSVSNLRSPPTTTFNRGFSPSARSSTSLSEEPGFHGGGGRYRGEPGSLPGVSELHAKMSSSTMVSPQVQALSLGPRASQSPPLQDSHTIPKHRSHSRGRLHPPFMSTLPSISSVHSPTYSNASELSAESNSPPYELGPPSANGATYQLPALSSSSNEPTPTLPPFSHSLAHLAYRADQQQQQQEQQYHPSQNG